MVIQHIPDGQPERLRLMTEDPIAAEEAGLINLDGHVWTQRELNEHWDHGYSVLEGAETMGGYPVFRTYGEGDEERVWQGANASIWWNVYELRADTRIDVLNEADMPGVWPMKGGFVACPRLALPLIDGWVKTSGEDVRIEGYQVFEDLNGVWRDDCYGIALPDPRGETGQTVTTYIPGKLDGQRVFVPDGYPGRVSALAEAEEHGWGRDDGLEAWADILDGSGGDVVVTLMREGDSVEPMWRNFGAVQCYGIPMERVGYEPPPGMNAAYLSARRPHSDHTLKELSAMQWSPPEPVTRARGYREI